MMLLNHVRHLVAEHARKLALGMNALDQAARDEDVASWRGEGADRFGFQNTEVPWQIGPPGEHREPAPDARHVVFFRRVRIERRGAEQTLRDGLAHLDFLRLADVAEPLRV